MNQDSDFSKNRAEEYGYDMWGYFVIPPFYNKLQLFRSNKPLVIEGGRGSGKTMLLRYLCHQTQFSPKRKKFDDKVFKRIGVYWKIDTQFTKLMSLRKKTEDEWNPYFINWGVLEIAEGIMRSLLTISNSSYCGINEETLKRIDFTPLNDYSADIPVNFDELFDYIKSQNRKFQVHISNLKGDFVNLPFDFIRTLITCICDRIPELSNTVFDVYIDEYENTLDYQSRIINTWIKHSELPLIFNVAMKRNAMRQTDTVGNEGIVDVNDYRKVSLDKLVEESFDVFASEIFLLRLKREGYPNISVDENKLFSTSEKDLLARNSEDYSRSIKAVIKKMFPSMSSKEVSLSMLKQPAFRNRINKDLRQFLTEKEVKQVMDYSEISPEGIVVMPALLNRKGAMKKIIVDAFINYVETKNTQYKTWVENNIFGCILYYYGALNRICPLYSGFDAFTTMSKDNLRHFLELCLRSINNEDRQLQVISPQSQALAVRSVSENMFSEIKSLGNRGNELYTFAIRLGTYFENARKKIAQSEPEQNHFNVKDTVSQKTMAFLDELVKWSVLYDFKLTKQKGFESGREYLLNPIYSSYFTISYRKKRRIDITNSDFETIAFGDADAFKRLLKTKFPENNNDEQPSLFKV